MSASDRAIGGLKHLMKSKLGARYVATANKRPGIGGNSQSCICGEPVAKELKQRVHNCPKCGLTADRDHVSANIVQLIAFGTTNESLKLLYRHPGRMSSDVESAKGALAKAAAPSRSYPALERSVKRRSLASRSRRSITDGKPAVVGKTCDHFQSILGIGT